MLVKNNQTNAFANSSGLIQQQSRSLNALSKRTELREKQKKPKPNQVLSKQEKRWLYHAGNACEIAAGACLNSAIVFSFHLLQIHPLGMILALGVSHFYLSAIATSKSRDKVVTNFMAGTSAMLGLLCAVSEPIGEWWEANQSKNQIISQNIQMYERVEKQPFSGGITPVVVAVLIGILAIWITSPKHTKN